MKKFSIFTVIYVVLWIILRGLYELNAISMSNSILRNISAQLLILGAFIFFVGYIINRFLVKFNEEKLNNWLLVYNLILMIAIIMTAINITQINSNWLIEFITNISYVGIGGCLLFGIYSIKELLKID